MVGFTSCIGDVDLDQVNDFEATPAFKVSLINFEFDEEELDAINVDEGHIPEDRINFDIPSNRQLERVVFEFEAENTFDDDFLILLTLLDNGVPTYTFDTITVTANSSEVDDIPTQEIDLILNPQVFNSNEISGELIYNGTITVAEPNILSFKSAGTFYIGI